MWPMRNERAAESGNAILKIRPAKIYLSIECKKRVQAPNKRNQSESEFGSVLRTSREAVRDKTILYSLSAVHFIIYTSCYCLHNKLNS